MKLAFFVPSLSASQLSYNLIKNINRFYEADRSAKVDISVFYEVEALPCIKPNFMISNSSDAWNYSGNIVSTTLSTAHKAIRFPRSKHSFYIYDLEWTQLTNKQSEILLEIYQTPKKILVKNVDHSDVIKKVWNRQVDHIVGEFNINKIVEAVA